MGIRHLRIFVAVYQLGSITQAARQLHLAQPSVSLAIRELEEYYGVHLFDRISRKLYRTQSGTDFYKYASHIVALYDELEHSARAKDACTSLRVGASVTVGNSDLPDFVSRFAALRPEVEVHAFVCNSGQLVQQLLENRLDLALVEGHIASPQLEEVPFRRGAMMFVAGRGHPVLTRPHLRLRDLTEYRFLLRERGSAGRAFFDELMERHGLTVTPQWESVSTQALVKAVSAGLGLSLLPEVLVRQDIAQGTVVPVPVENAHLEREFFVIFHKDKYLPAAAQSFIALCKARAAEEDRL